MIYTERYVHYVPVYDLYTEYHSADQVFAFVSAALQSFPDFTVTMKSSRFTLRQDGLSYILAKVNIQGTHIRKLLMTDPVHDLTHYVNEWSPFSYLYN